ncbi:MAG: pyridoxamine 5'-phosphate oxidase family protein [Lachnospiraceae bacterium]|nr:pyridoxamine 5'-phosphate oxidase family protein [Lachnospiraceae bacterium]
MRRKEREVTDTAEIRKILEKAEVLRIALNNGTYPYVIPVNFGFEMNEEQLTLFFHGAKHGTKNKLIEEDNHAAFEVDCSHMLLKPTGSESCTASFAYESVIGQGKIEMADESEKEKLLTLLLSHYGIETDSFNAVYLANTVVYKIHAVNYTAKRRVNDRV